jgi:hypothetical protein
LAARIWLNTDRVENDPPLNVESVAQTARTTVVNARKFSQGSFFSSAIS